MFWKTASVSILSVPFFLLIYRRFSSQWVLLVYGMSRVMEPRNTVAPNPTNEFASGERHIVRMLWNYNSVGYFVSSWLGWLLCTMMNYLLLSLPPCLSLLLSLSLLKKLTRGLCFHTWKPPHRNAWHSWLESESQHSICRPPQSPHRPQGLQGVSDKNSSLDFLSECLLQPAAINLWIHPS